LHSFLAGEEKTMTKGIGRFHSWLLAAGSLAVFPPLTLASDLKTDEVIVFFPTPAHLSEDGRTWTTRVHGWIFEPETDGALRNAAIASFRNALGLSADEARSLVFQQRARAFLADNERGKRVAIQIGDREFELEPSEENGHFFGTVQLDAQTVNRLAHDGRLGYTAVTDRRDPRVFAGDIHLIGPAGVSVISDIDDTIKVTEVTDRRKLVQNTFLHPFRAVDGMAGVYRRWSSGGAKFHFVSASPWQLYEPLAEFARQAGFPAATFHLRQFRLKDASVLSLLADPLEAKLLMIESLMATFPHRRFLLVGDSGERDPEVYGRIAEKYPDQVLRIYIRDVTGQVAQSPRYQAAFGRLPGDKWQLFQDPSTIQD
jgi:phosphatidate phosphatase APP1